MDPVLQDMWDLDSQAASCYIHWRPPGFGQGSIGVGTMELERDHKVWTFQGERTDAEIGEEIAAKSRETKDLHMHVGLSRVSDMAVPELMNRLGELQEGLAQEETGTDATLTIYVHMTTAF